MCRDDRAVITDSSWVILCPPTEDVTSQAIITVSGEPSELLSSEEIGMHKNSHAIHTTLNFLHVA